MMYSPIRRRRRRARAPISRIGLSGGVALLGGGYLGLFSARAIHAWAVTYAAGATNAPALPSGVPDLATYNNLAVLARPTWQSQLSQWGFTIATWLLGMAMPWRIGKLVAYGASLGSALHAGYQLINGWIVLPLMQSTTWGQRAYGAELGANYSLGKMTQPTTTTVQGLGQPPGVGRPRGGTPPIRTLPGQQQTRVPAALVTGRGASPFPNGTPASLGQAPNPDYTGAPNAGPPPNTVPNLPNGNCPDGSTAVTNPLNLDMPYCVSNTPPPATTTPPPATPPPATPPPATPPPIMTTPTPPPSNGTPPPATPACPLPWPGAPQPCCGTSPCSCGVQQSQGVPGTVLGQPPDGAPAHPLFAMMLAPRRMPNAA